MSKSSSWLRKLLVGLVCVNCCILIIVCAIAAILTMRLNDPASPSTGGSSLTTASKPTAAPTDPTTDPTANPTDPTAKPTDPTVKPTDPTTKPTDPTTKPTDPTTKPTEPTTKPTEPTTRPTEPTTKPTEPTTRPTEPTTQPTEPTTRPTEPTTQPTEPTEPTVPFDEEKFFSESVFLGDSVTLGLRNYCIQNKSALHGATILCAGSYAVRHAIAKVGGTDVISITYQGQKMRPEDAIAAIGAKRVFIMLGLNDIGLLGIDKTITNWGTLVKNIRAKCPDIEIYIQSGTPLYKGKGSLNNTNMDKYNGKLQQFCKDNGCFFVNVAEALKDSQGVLQKQYCSDEYCHLTTAGVKAWIAYLKAYAAANHR